MDDFEAILQTVLRWKEGNVWGKVAVLFSQHGDHRILYSRLVYILYYSVFGNIDFRNLMILGNLNLVVASAFMCYFIKQTGLKYWQIPALVSVFLICDMNTYESATIAMYAWQNHGIVALFFATLFFWHNRWMVPGIIAQFFLILSSGNGMIGAFGIAIYSLSLGRKYFIACATSFAAFTGLYFIGYERYPDPTLLPFDTGTVVTFFIKMTGCPFSFDASFFYGLLMLGSLPFLIPFKRRVALWPMFVILFFILGSEGTTALFRSCTTFAQFQTSRYQIYPQMLVGVIFVLMLLKNKKLVVWAAYGIMTLYVFVYWPYNFKFGYAGIMRTEYRVTEVHGLQGDKYWHPEKEKAAQIAKAASNAGIYYIEDNR